MAPRRTNAPEPTNTSRAAGRAAPASAAATAPRMYDPGGDDEPTAAAAAAESPLQQMRYVEEIVAPQAEPEDVAFTRSVREGAIPIEAMGSADVSVLEFAAAEAIQDPEELAAEIKRIRQFRKPLGAYTQKLALPQRLGYHRHWFNDVAGRISEALANGFKHVLGTDGKPIARCVGTGRDKGPQYAYAMEIPSVFHEEDMASRHRAATEKVEALKGSPFRSQPGAAKPSDKGKFYDPHEEAGTGPLTIEKL